MQLICVFVFAYAKSLFSHKAAHLLLALKAPITTIADFANTVDPDETAHNEPSHLDLKCLPSSL